METKNIMIGNYLQDIDSKELFRVNKVGIITVGNGVRNAILASRLKGVELTEDMLPDLGFTKTMQGVNFTLYQLGIVKLTYHVGEFTEDLTGKNLQFVHELQNIATVLFNQTITFKDK